MAKILVIEDQKMLCLLYGSALTHTKHQVALAYTGEEGIQEALRERPDLVIMDLKLPGLSGPEVAHQLSDRGIFPSAPLIIATSLGEEAGPIAESLNAVALMHKPFHLGTMLAEVEKALESDTQPLPAA